MRRQVLAIGWAAALYAACTSPRAQALDNAAAFAASESAIGRTVDEAVLLDRDSQPVPLSSYRGKPLLVSFIYTGCFRVCPTTTQALADAVKTANAAFGAEQYRVISIGFNQPADTPQAMKAFAAQQRVGAPNWDFLSAPSTVVGGLTRNFGFAYAPTAAGIDHVLQFSLVDAQGRIVRQIYGDKPDTQAIVEPLRQLLRNVPLPARSRWSDLVDRVRLLCTVYDPKTGTYRTSYGLAIEIAGGVTFALVMAIFFIGEWRERRRLQRRAEAST